MGRSTPHLVGSVYLYVFTFYWATPNMAPTRRWAVAGGGALVAAKHLAWSYSRLKMAKECLGKLWHCAVAPKGDPGRVEYRESEAQRAGKEIDEALCSRISNNTPLPAKFAKWEPLTAMVCATPGAKLTQVQVALDSSFRPVGSRDWDNVWVRAVYDLIIRQPSYAFLWDWKNGKIWVDEDQLRLSAAIEFIQSPEIDVIDTSYVWLSHDQISPKIYRRSELADMWHTFLPDVERMQIAHQNKHYPYNPSARACGYCDANRAGKCPAAAVPYKGK